ncbi:hypothetical protein I4U23_027304 [Adineta vaga]|nr:hypothetical protein I4U23_027304 [Adineta vaga]
MMKKGLIGILFVFIIIENGIFSRIIDYDPEILITHEPFIPQLPYESVKLCAKLGDTCKTKDDCCSSASCQYSGCCGKIGTKGCKAGIILAGTGCCIGYRCKWTDNINTSTACYA